MVGMIAGGAANILGWAIFILLVSYFVLLDSDNFGQGFLQINIPGHAGDLRRMGSELSYIWNAFLRGQILIAIDLRRRLGLVERPADQVPMNVVVHTNDGTVSLLVDDIGDVFEVSEERFELPPETISQVAKEMVHGVYKLDEKLLLRLNIDKAADVAATVGQGAERLS